MPNIYYLSSRGKKFDMLSFESAKLQTAQFHSVEWKPEVVKRQFGSRISRMTKDAQTFPCTFKFKGSRIYRKQLIDNFIYETEWDCFHNTPGRIYWDDQYIDALLTVHNTYPDGLGQTYTTIDASFFASYPFWIQELLVTLRPSGGSSGEFPENVKGYPVDRSMVYGYEYAYPYSPLTTYFNVDSPLDAEFMAVCYGPTDNVTFYINGHKYQVNRALRANQFMVIDARQTTPPEKRCYLVYENGTVVNCFNDRATDSPLFTPISGGNAVINYSRGFGIDLTIFQERSAPI